MSNRYLSIGIRAPDLGSPVPKTMRAAAAKSESEREKKMKQVMKMKQEKKVKENLQNTKKQVRKKYIRRRRRPVWENDEDRWWRRRRRSSMDDWPPGVRAFFESMQNEEEEVDGDAEPEEAEINHHFLDSDLIEIKEPVEEEEEVAEDEGDDTHKLEEELKLEIMNTTEPLKEIKQPMDFKVMIIRKSEEVIESVGEALVATLDSKEEAHAREEVRWTPAGKQQIGEDLKIGKKLWPPKQSAKLALPEPPKPHAQSPPPPKPPELTSPGTGEKSRAAVEFEL